MEPVGSSGDVRPEDNILTIASSHMGTAAAEVDPDGNELVMAKLITEEMKYLLGRVMAQELVQLHRYKHIE